MYYNINTVGNTLKAGRSQDPPGKPIRHCGHKGQVTNALDGLCLALGEKSLCFWTEVHNTNSQQTTSHAWDNVHKLDTETQKLQFTYWQAQSALQWLNIDADYLEMLHKITDNDLKVASNITNDQ